jgi:hypothetical protein
MSREMRENGAHCLAAYCGRDHHDAMLNMSG